MPHHRTLGGWTTWARTEPRLDRHPSTASPRIGQKSGRKLVWAPGVTTRLHLWNDKVCVSLSRLHLMLSKVVEVNKARNPGVVLPSLPRLLSRHHLLLLPRCILLVLLLYKVVFFTALFGCCKDFVLFSHFFVIPRKHGIAVQISKHTHTSENGIAV